ncbi:MAG TPA: MmcB family DNA repair protein [Xanthobacteraceae bacterium]|nr:MmcB family DNA repair protein [Xanthobacteraceae bacterium]
MSLELFHTEIVVVDGRQSATALSVARGTSRLMRSLGFSCVAEMPLTSGRRADLVALAPDGEISIIEIKSSLEDFRADHKWPEYRWHCDRLYFATAPHVPLDIFPHDAGLILADGYGAEIVRGAPEHRLAGATRRSMLLRYGRLAALRLQALTDPAAPVGAEF